MSNKIVLSFDLDFTLIDNTEGIINSFKYAIDKYNLPKINEEKIKKMIGIPLDKMFAQVSDLTSSDLIEAFREYYRNEGIFQVKLFSGVKEKLEELKTAALILGIITSKKEELAIKLLKNLEILQYFSYVYGETDNIKTKTDPEIKKRLHTKYPNHQIIIIGDHPNDRYLAEMLNCPFIGVLTGHHSERELKQNASGKVMILDSVMNINLKNINSLLQV